MRRNFLVADILRNAVQGSARAKLRPVDHVLEVRERNDFRFQHAVHVDIAGHHELDALLLQLISQGLDRVICGSGHSFLVFENFL